MSIKQSRDPRLLDALEEAPRKDIKTSVWRLSKESHPPTNCRKVFGRWDDGTFDVLYTSLERKGAIAEVEYHLRSGQPVFPRKVKYRLIEIEVNIEGALDLSDRRLLQSLGVDMTLYGRMPYADLQRGEYRTSQKIGEMAFFHEFPAVISPSARMKCDNMMIICEYAEIAAFEDYNDLGVKEIQEWVTELDSPGSA